MKKIVSIIISAIIFIGIVAGIAGMKLLAIIGLIAHSVHSVWLYGRNWSVERKIKGIFNPPPKTEGVGKPDVLDEIKNQDDPSKLDKIKLL